MTSKNLCSWAVLAALGDIDVIIKVTRLDHGPGHRAGLAVQPPSLLPGPDPADGAQADRRGVGHD